MPHIVAHHENFTYIERNSIIDYMYFINLLFICKQDLKGFQITNDKGNIIIHDALILHVFNVYEGVNKIHQYVDANFVGAPLTMKMLFMNQSRMMFIIGNFASYLTSKRFI